MFTLNSLKLLTIHTCIIFLVTVNQLDLMHTSLVSTQYSDIHWYGMNLTFTLSLFYQPYNSDIYCGLCHFWLLVFIRGSGFHRFDSMSQPGGKRVSELIASEAGEGGGRVRSWSGTDFEGPGRQRTFSLGGKKKHIVAVAVDGSESAERAFDCEYFCC